jgi:heterotetrameric sarcosine oxidase delta subunit
MLRIECPWCGARDEPEFTYGGETNISRPSSGCSDEKWSQYLFFRSNPKGEHAERWRHTHGCGQWFNLARDTVTHEIKATWRMGETR